MSIEPEINGKHIKEFMLERYHDFKSKNIYNIHPGYSINTSKLKSHKLNDEKPLKNLDTGLRNFYRKQKKILNSFFEAEHLFNENSLHYNGNDTINEINDLNTTMGINNENTPFLVDRRKNKKKKFNYNGFIIKLSLAINIILLIAKIVAAILTNSVSIISSTIDSAIDILSSVVSYCMIKLIKKFDVYKNPLGRSRLEPIGILIISITMSVASFQVVVESVKRIITNADLIPKLSYVSIGIVVATIFFKFLLFLLCIPSNSDTVKALKQDHINDVLTNSFALAGFAISTKLWDYADSVFAILLSIFIIANWLITGKSNISILTGKTAPPEIIQKYTYICLTHNDCITAIDTVRAYTVGSRYFLEIHIVLPENTLLYKAHNIGESLQLKLECLPEVERAFVHLDYETCHNPLLEHRLDSIY